MELNNHLCVLNTYNRFYLKFQPIQQKKNGNIANKDF